MSKDEFLFFKTGKRRDRAKNLHDLLIAAKDGLKKTRIMYGANLNHTSMTELLKLAEAEELIEEVEARPYKRHWLRKPTLIWKTTEKGLKHAKNIYDYSKLLLEIESK